jgi:hypothetical protein
MDRFSGTLLNFISQNRYFPLVFKSLSSACSSQMGKPYCNRRSPRVRAVVRFRRR